jgi:hypothetical protein
MRKKSGSGFGCVKASVQGHVQPPYVSSADGCTRKFGECMPGMDSCVFHAVEQCVCLWRKENTYTDNARLRAEFLLLV